MKITKVSVRKVDNENLKVKGIANVELDGCFVIEHVRVIEKPDGTLFAAMPSKKFPNGEYKDSCHPINEETRAMFNKAVIDEYMRIKDLPVEKEE
jgi:stage V sporulation protein G